MKVFQFSVPRILFWCENFSFFNYILMFSRLYIWFWWIWSPHHGTKLSSSYSNFENYSFFKSSPDFMIPKSDLSGQTWYIWLAFTILQAVHMVLMVYMVSSPCNLSVVCNIFTEIRKIGLFWKFPSSQFPVYCFDVKIFLSLVIS